MTRLIRHKSRLIVVLSCLVAIAFTASYLPRLKISLRRQEVLTPAGGPLGRLINAGRPLDEIRSYIQKHPLSVNEFDSFMRETVLEAAARGERFDVVRILVENGAEVNGFVVNGMRVNNPLCIAVILSNFEIASYLLDHGADPHALLSSPLGSQESAYDWAMRSKDSRISKLFSKYAPTTVSQPRSEGVIERSNPASAERDQNQPF